MKKRNSKRRLLSTGSSGIRQWRTGSGVIKAVIGGAERLMALPFLKEKCTRTSVSPEAFRELEYRPLKCVIVFIHYFQGILTTKLPTVPSRVRDKSKAFLGRVGSFVWADFVTVP